MSATDIYNIVPPTAVSGNFIKAGNITVNNTAFRAENISWNTSRNANPLRFIGSTEYAKVPQPPQGQLQFSCVKHDQSVLPSLAKYLSENSSSEMNISGNASANPRLEFRFYNVTLMGLSVSLDAQNNIARETFTFSFTNLVSI